MLCMIPPCWLCACLSVLQGVLTVDKRVTIMGAPDSSNQHVILDHRANHPAFVINR